MAEYLKEFKELTIACDVEEHEEMKNGRFVGCLDVDLRQKLNTHVNLTFIGVCKLVQTYEE